VNELSGLVRCFVQAKQAVPKAISAEPARAANAISVLVSIHAPKTSASAIKGASTNVRPAPTSIKAVTMNRHLVFLETAGPAVIVGVDCVSADRRAVSVTSFCCADFAWPFCFHNYSQ
jgi:hypothetical protein